MINTTVNNAVANLSKETKKSIGDVSKAINGTLDTKIGELAELLKTSSNQGGQGGGGGSDDQGGDRKPGELKLAEALSKQKALENDLNSTKTRLQELEKERTRLEKNRNETDFRTKVSDLLNELKVNNTKLAYNALSPSLTYSPEDGSITLQSESGDVSLTKDILKDWLEREGAMFLPATGGTGSGARNAGDGRSGNAGVVTMEKVLSYDKMTKADRTKLRAQLAAAAAQR
jgi:hypothetical protein